MNTRKIVAALSAVLLLIGAPILIPNLLENVDADEIVVFQSPGGSMSVVTSPGWTYQGFAKVTVYKRRATIHFTTGNAEEGIPDTRLPIQFNDSAKGTIKGSISYELPLTLEQMLEIHSRFNSQEALERSLVRPALNKSIYMTGPLMTAYESVRERRPQLIQFVEDQVQNGVYLTRTYEVERPDEFQPEVKKRVTVVEVLRSQNGQPQRAEEAQLAKFGVNTFNFAIEELDYEDRVDQQIQAQQAITMAVQTSIAKAKQAEQDALTAKAEAQAKIEQTRAVQEVEKTAAVVQAEKGREVARLAAEQAKYYKEEQDLRAAADSNYKRQVMNADGALAQKLEAYKAVNATWAQAFSQFQGTLVPGVVMGSGNGSSSTNALQAMIEMLTAKTAKDLALDVTPGRQQ